MSNQLQELINFKKQYEANEAKLIAEAKEKWPSSIKKVFNVIQDWLSGYDGMNISIIPNAQSQQDMYGTTSKMMVSISKNCYVTLTPIGNARIGSVGIIEMINHQNRKVIIRQPRWDDWVFQSQSNSLRIEDSPSITGEKLDFNKDNFKEKLLWLLKD